MSNYFPSKAIRQQEVVWLQRVRRALSQVFTMLIVVCALGLLDEQHVKHVRGARIRQSSSEHTIRLRAFLTCPVQQPPAGRIQNNRTEEQQVFSIFEGAECERLLF